MPVAKDYYVYPAVIDFDDDGISITFPDLPGCFSCAFSENEIINKAREAMGLHLYNMEDDGDYIPEPSDILSVPHDDKQAVVLVDVLMPPVRERIRNTSMNKMCTIPAWLLVEAQSQGISFSRTLQEGLMTKLGIMNKIRKKSR